MVALRIDPSMGVAYEAEARYSITLEKLSRPRRFFEGKTIMGKTIKNTNDG
jgi:hypothetical protein